MRKTDFKICVFEVYMYYMHYSYQTSIIGKNCVYYIQIFMVCKNGYFQQLFTQMCHFWSLWGPLKYYQNCLNFVWCNNFP